MITSPIPDPLSGIAFTAAGQQCFYCGERSIDPAIHWSGFTGEVYIHEACVVELAIRLFRDLHQLRLQRAGRRTP